MHKIVKIFIENKYKTKESAVLVGSRYFGREFCFFGVSRINISHLVIVTGRVVKGALPRGVGVSEGFARMPCFLNGYFNKIIHVLSPFPKIVQGAIKLLKA